MLFGQDGGRHQDRHLIAVLDHLEGGPYRHLGLAVADIAADQPVHRLVGGEIVDDLGDGLVLARGLVKGEGLLQFMEELGRRGESPALAQFPVGIDIEQFLGDLPHLFLDLGLGRLPGLGAEFVDFRLLIGEPLVAGDQVEPVHRQVELVAVAVFNVDEVVGDPLELHGDQAQVDTQAVVAMDDDIAVLEFGEAQRHRLSCCLLFAAAETHLAEEFTLGEQVDLAARAGRTLRSGDDRRGRQGCSFSGDGDLVAGQAAAGDQAV